MTGAPSTATSDSLPPLFVYWASDDVSPLAQVTAEWRRDFPQFRIFGDRDVIPLIGRYFPGSVELYKAIRLPAARSDIARLLLLYEIGGFYLDCHFGLRDAAEVSRLYASLAHREAIFFDRDRRLPNAHSTDTYLPINGIIFSRPRSELIMQLCRQAFDNLAEHRRLERESGFVPYDLCSLTGAALYAEVVLQPGSGRKKIRPDLVDRIEIISEEIAPAERDRYRTYGGQGQHWSERQEDEPLFDTAAERHDGWKSWPRHLWQSVKDALSPKRPG